MSSDCLVITTAFLWFTKAFYSLPLKWSKIPDNEATKSSILITPEASTPGQLSTPHYQAIIDSCHFQSHSLNIGGQISQNFCEVHNYNAFSIISHKIYFLLFHLWHIWHYADFHVFFSFSFFSEIWDILPFVNKSYTLVNPYCNKSLFFWQQITQHGVLILQCIH